MNNSTFRVSIVIAAWPDATGLSNCLSALEAQRDEQTEVIAALTINPLAELVTRFAWVQWLDPTPDALIPNLWSKGMAAASGEIVAITIAHFVAAFDWLEQIRQAHRRLDSAGIGGPIDPPRGGSAVDWATYFLRYSNYFKYEQEQIVTDIPGDNASYKREVIAAHWESISEGFWEPEFHRLLLVAGQSLTFVPGIRVTQRASFGIRRFCAQRLSHGRHFGRDRMRDKSWMFRLASLVAAPLIPVMLLRKIVRRLTRKRSYLGPFLASLPVMLLFIVSWALGEAWGYVSIGRKETPALSARKHLSV
jgi:hypothetical protein